jgi:hypothetical protein
MRIFGICAFEIIGSSKIQFADQILVLDLHLTAPHPLSLGQSLPSNGDMNV